MLRHFASTAVMLAFATGATAQALPKAEPESVGMSADRLARIGQVFQAEIDAGELPGAVIMVAREGKLVYSTALGDLDPAADTAMTEDAIFRIYSMTKPLVSVGAMILLERVAIFPIQDSSKA